MIEFRAFIEGLDDVALVKVAKDLRDYPEDEDYLEETLWEIAKRSWHSWAWGTNRGQVIWHQRWSES